jgi:AmiR/NasT family two-component response regulator
MIQVFSPEAPLAFTVAQQLQCAGHTCAVLAQPTPGLAPLDAPMQGNAPRQVVVAARQAVDELSLAGLLDNGARAPSCPVSLIGPAPGNLAALLERGLTGWWPAGLLDDGQALSAALTVDLARWQRESALRAELAEVREQLDGRKWVERAKGVLMTARGIGEDEAFRLLRGASMQANLKVGEVSRSVLEATQWADAINRSGQLRMLSQRLVKLAAQRLAGIDVRRARGLQEEAVRRAQDNLDHLAALPMVAQGPPSLQDSLAAANAAWARLKRAVDLRQNAQALAAVDLRADSLLEAAEDLTNALELQAGRRALHIINLCGCQRMRVQRLAKIALLGFLLDRPSGSVPLAPLLDEFDAALVVLEQAPLSNPEIRDALACARDEWLRLLQGLRGPDGDDSRVALTQSSDVLLDTFDRLTVYYEHSLQVIMS